MKYIRTKNGVYENFFVLTYEDDHVRCVVGSDGKVGIVVKEADTIEELCDELIAVTDDGRHIKLKSVFDLMGSGSYIKRTYRIDCPYEVYGAIWTDLGLIYVAKLNGKGEFELL